MDQEPEAMESRKRPREGEDEPQGFWKAQLEAIYVRRNPKKVDMIPALLQKYKGSEAVLYKKVCQKYDLNPNKFHIEPEAWLEYELTEHHGAALRPSGGDTAEAEPFEVVVSTVSGVSSCKISELRPNNMVKEVLIRASEALCTQAWCSHLSLNTKKLHMDANLSEAGVSAGSSLTLVQEPDAELIATLQRFGDGPPAAEVPNSVHVALCLELRAVGRDATHLLGAFHCPKKARDAVVKAFSQEYHGVMNAEFRDQGTGEECRISSSATEISLSLADCSGVYKIWKVERTSLV